VAISLSPENQVLVVIAMVAIGGVGLLLAEIRAWKRNYAACEAVLSSKRLIALRLLLGVLSIGFGYIINGYTVFGILFANGILEHKPFGRDFIAPWSILTVVINAGVAALLPDLVIALRRWKREKRAEQSD
jgi:hypothetical protein